MGGDFTFNFQGSNVKCNLNDFNVSKSLFLEEKKNVKIFKGNNNI
jgi:hypothetical protein